MRRFASVAGGGGTAVPLVERIEQPLYSEGAKV